MANKTRTKILPATRREIPRPFVFEWGTGHVVEEASVRVKHDEHSWESTIQLLRCDDGGENLRFCVFHGKRFSRMPLIISPDELSALIAEASKQPRIKALLNKSTGKLAR